MKLECTQCGAQIAVTSPDAFASCAYCGAKAVVKGFSGGSFFHRPVLTAREATRKFPPGEVASVSLYWFPYDPDSLAGVFTQPYPEMEGYTPPSADRRVWESQSAEGTVIPPDPDLTGESGVIYHPFLVVLSASSGQGTMVDAVSGVIPGKAPSAVSPEGFDPLRESLKAFFRGVVPALVIFFLLRGVSLFWAAVTAMAAAIFIPELLPRIMGRKE